MELASQNRFMKSFHSNLYFYVYEIITLKNKTPYGAACTCVDTKIYQMLMSEMPHAHYPVVPLTACNESHFVTDDCNMFGK